MWSPYIVASFSLATFLVDLARGSTRDPKETWANFKVWAVGRGGWTMLLALVVADFTYYWKHRLSHETRILWAYHSVHHSSKEFNLSTAIRLPWLGTMSDALFYIPMAVMGFSPTLIVVAKTLVLLYQYWIHTQEIQKLGWMDKIFNSPSNHRVHHGRNLQYIDKNHGGILMIWDRLFGTYQAEEEPVIYGLTKPLETYGALSINLQEPLQLIREVSQLKSIREGFIYLFKPQKKTITKAL